MSFLEDLLKGLAKFETVVGRDTAQALKYAQLGNKVKRVEAPSFTNEQLRAIADQGGSSVFNSLPQNQAYQRDLGQSQQAYGNLRSEMANPSANRYLNNLLSVTQKEQERQRPEQLLTPETILKDTGVVLSHLPVGGGSLKSAMLSGGALSAAGAAGYAPKGEELTASLIAGPLGAFSAGAGYGLNKLGSNLANKVNVKPAKQASDQATKNLGLTSKTVSDLGGWPKAKEFATDFYGEAKRLGLPTKNKFDRANAILELTDVIDQDFTKQVGVRDGGALADDIINKLSSNKAISFAASKDPQTYDWFVNQVRSAADESGVVSLPAMKELIKTFQSIGGGFKRTTGDASSSVISQLSTGFRGAVRDTFQKVAPDLGDMLTRWSNYIDATNSIASSNPSRSSGLSIPGVSPMLSKIPGTGATKASDFVSNLLATKGNPETVSQPQVIPELLSNIGNIAQNVGPKISSLVGGGALTRDEQKQQMQYDADYIKNLESQYLQPTKANSSNLGSDESKAIKQLLAVSVLGGKISGAEATAVLSLLGLEQEKPREMTSTAKNRLYEIKTAQSDLQTIQNILDEYSGASGPLAGGVAKKIPGTKASKINSDLARITQSIATSLEGGKLSDRDREFYTSITPQVDDTESEREYKISALLDSLKRNLAIFEDVYGNGSQSTDVLDSILSAQ